MTCSAHKWEAAAPLGPPATHCICYAARHTCTAVRAKLARAQGTQLTSTRCSTAPAAGLGQLPCRTFNHWGSAVGCR